MAAGRVPRGPILRATCVIGAVLALGACDGSNLFEGEVAEPSPTVTLLAAPASVSSGERVNVQVNGSAPRGVRFIEVRFTGAAGDTLRDDFTGDNDVESAFFELDLIQPVGSQLFIEAYVQDINGRNSAFRRDTVQVEGVITPGTTTSP